MRVLLFVGPIFLLCVTRATALTGMELKKHCSEPHGTVAEISCAAYIHGLLDGMFLADKAAPNGIRYCPPGGVNIEVEQGVVVVQKYLRDHPEELHREAGALAGLGDLFRLSSQID
jgi:hypothetical protein